MKIGPLSISDSENIKSLLENKKIDFEIELDKNLEQKQLAEFNQNASHFPRQMAGKLNLQYIYFAISDSDFNHIKEDLEKYGVTTSASDGSYELGEED